MTYYDYYVIIKLILSSNISKIDYSKKNCVPRCCNSAFAMFDYN